MSSPFSVHHDFMAASGLLSYWTAQDFVKVGQAAIDTGVGLATNSWNNNPNKYEEAGNSAGEFIGASAMAAANLGMNLHAVRIHNRIEGMVGPKGQSVKFLKDGAKNSITSLESILEQNSSTSMVKTAEIGGKTVEDLLKAKNFKSAYFTEKGLASTAVKASGFMKGLVLPMGGALLVGAMARGALGFAGKIIDDASKDYDRQRTTYYDTRFFNTQQAQMSSYQQIGQAMQAQEQRMVSVARIYHSH